MASLCFHPARVRAQPAPPQVPINAPFVTTTPESIAEMLKLASVSKQDVVYDLGAGDGRIVIAAARKLGARGVGIEMDAERVRVAQENARRSGVAGLVSFRRENFFDADIREASVVTLYLLPEANLALRPKLLRELKPGARIVSNCFGMGDWRPEREVDLKGCKIYLWRIPGGGPSAK